MKAIILKYLEFRRQLLKKINYLLIQQMSNFCKGLVQVV